MWKKPYNFGSDPLGVRVVATPDGGVVTTNGVRFDAQGNVVWQKALGGIVSDISAKADGSFVVTSQFRDSTGTYRSGVAKYDGQGNLIWRKALLGESEEARAITTTTDGNYVMAGVIETGDNQIYDWVVVKLDNAGNVLWRKDFYNPNAFPNNIANAVTATPDGGVVVAGNKYINEDDSDWRVVKYDSQGNAVWSAAIQGLYKEYAYSATTTSDGTVWVSGIRTYRDYWTYETYRFDNNGNYSISTAPSASNGRLGSAVTHTANSENFSYDEYSRYLIGMTATKDGSYVISQKNENGNYSVGSSGPQGFGKALAAGETVSGIAATTDGGLVLVGSFIGKLGSPSPSPITITSLTARPNPVVAGQALTFSANLGNVTGGFSYTLTNGQGSGLRSFAISATNNITTTLVAAGSGPQTYTFTVSNELGRTSRTVQVTVTAAQTAKFSVFHYDGNDKKSPTANNRPQPRLRLHNEGTVQVPYQELTIRYWLTVENFKPLTYQEIYYAPTVGIPNVKMRYVALPTPRQGAGGYIEYSFTSQAGTSMPNTNSGPIHSAFGKEDWSRFNETNDYSWASATSFTKNNRITVYRNGVLVGGVEPPAGSRVAADPADSELRVIVLGNPVTEDQVEVDVYGAEGEALQVRLVDAQGRLVGQTQHLSASDQQRFRLEAEKGAAGLLLLQVATPTQQRTIKLLKR